MKTKTFVCGACGALPFAILIANLSGIGSAAAGDLTLTRYIDLSIARLELSKQAWTTTKQPPSREAMAALFAGYGSDETDYLAYTSAHREAIDGYLSAHPPARQRIDALSAAIAGAIAE